MLLNGVPAVAGAPASGVTTVILDQFTDTNGTALASHTIAPTNVPATSWSVAEGTPTVTIQTNKAQSTSSSDGILWLDSGVSDCTITCDVDPIANGNSGIYFRCTAANASWMARWQQGATMQLQIYERNPGYTLRANTALAGADGEAYTMTIVLSGTSIAVTVNATTVNYTSATNQAATKHGLYVGGANGATWDNFKVTVP